MLILHFEHRRSSWQSAAAPTTIPRARRRPGSSPTRGTVGARRPGRTGSPYPSPRPLCSWRRGRPGGRRGWRPRGSSSEGRPGSRSIRGRNVCLFVCFIKSSHHSRDLPHDRAPRYNKTNVFFVTKKKYEGKSLVFCGSQLFCCHCCWCSISMMQAVFLN